MRRAPPDRLYLNMRSFTGQMGIAHSRAANQPAYIREGWRSIETLPASGLVLMLFDHSVDYAGRGPKDCPVALVELHDDWWAITGQSDPMKRPISNGAIGWFPIPNLEDLIQ